MYGILITLAIVAIAYYLFKGKMQQKQQTPQLSKAEWAYAQTIDWQNIFNDKSDPTSMKGMMKRMAVIYKEQNGNVIGNQEFYNLQSKLNEQNQLIGDPIVNYKNLFDRILVHVEYKKEDEEDYSSYEEAINLIDNIVKEESKERQKALITKQNEIAKNHRCSIHNEPVKYAFSLNGTALDLAIIDKCCEQSIQELSKKLQS